MKDAFTALQILAVENFVLAPTSGGFCYEADTTGEVVITSELAHYLIKEGFAKLGSEFSLMLEATDFGREVMSEYAVAA